MNDIRVYGNGVCKADFEEINALAEQSPQGIYDLHIKDALANGGYVIINDGEVFKTKPYKLEWTLKETAPKITFARFVLDVKNPNNSGWKIDERQMIQELQNFYHLSRINSVFYDQDGMVRDDAIKKNIQNSISVIFDKDLNRLTNAVFGALCNYCEHPEPVPDDSSVHLKGGISLKFTDDGVMTRISNSNAVTRNRLPVVYDPDAKCPVFLDFIKELLFPEDIPMLQEYLGYLLIPSCKGQVMMYVKGQAGIGKSILSAVVSSMLGSSCTTGNICELDENQFAVARLEGRLAFIDDDVKNKPLSDTGNFKKCVTASNYIKISAERKGKDAHEFTSYCRFFCVGNGDFAAFDRSDGFYRRLVVIECKPTKAHKTDATFEEKIIAELSGIFNFALEGLQRLKKNGLVFSISERSKQIMATKKAIEIPELDFIKDADWFEIMTGEFKDDYAISSERLITLFHDWCRMNDVDPTPDKAARNKINEILKGFGIEYTRIKYAGKRVRGYVGIREKQSENLYKFKKASAY